MAAEFTIKRNDLLKTLRVRLSDVNGAINLLNTTVAFHMTAAVDGTPKVNAPASIEDAAGGIVTYAWQGTDTDTAGTYIAEFEITYPSGKKLTVPTKVRSFRVIVEPDIA